LTLFINVKPATLDAYQRRIAFRIKPSIGALKLSALKPHSVQTFYNDLQRGTKHSNALSPKSIQNIHGILHKAFTQALELGYIRVNPINACTIPKIVKLIIKPLDNEQIALFLKTIAGHKYETLFVTDLFLGLRQGELLGLTWDCINFDSGIIHIYRQLQFLNGVYTFQPLKNSKSRRITPARFILDLLRKHYREQCEARLLAGSLWNDGDFVFCNEFGHHLSRSTTYHNFKDIISKIGLPKTRLHDLRHTYAVTSLQAGDDIKTLQDNLGHHTAAFTLDTYGHVTEGMKQDSAERMDRFIKSLSNT
jgi:integrase